MIVRNTLFRQAAGLSTCMKLLTFICMLQVPTVMACDQCGCNVNGANAVSLSDLRVTSGSLQHTLGGHLSVVGPRSRAVVHTASEEQKVNLKFRYRGHSTVDVPLISGLLRRQIGLKLASKDGCNLIYVMWEVHPEERISVFIKHNPGLTLSEECGAEGYTRLESDTDFSATSLKTAYDKKDHRLSAHLKPVQESFDKSINDYRDFHLVVCTDGETVFEKTLHNFPVDIRGPPGIRSDNGSFLFKLAYEQPKENPSKENPGKEKPGKDKPSQSADVFARTNGSGAPHS